MNKSKKSIEILKIDDYVEKNFDEKYFSSKSIIIGTFVLLIPILFSFLIICLVQFF